MIKILSVFDGLSCGRLTLEKLFTKKQLEKIIYLASEIDQAAIKVAKNNFPDIVHIGDVRKITKKMVGEIYLLIGGSPCTDFSINGKMKGMVTKDGLEITTLKQYLKLKKEGFEFEGESYLFWEFVRLVKELKPKYFLLENVVFRGKTKRWEEVITKETGVNPLHINSSLLSAQNRDRMYWTNIPGACVPKNNNVHVGDVIRGGLTGYGYRGVKNLEGKYIKKGTARKDLKFNCLTTSNNTSHYKTKKGTVKQLTPELMELVQTLPVGYTDVKGVSPSNRIKMIGNSWTRDVILHLMRGLKKDLVKHLEK